MVGIQETEALKTYAEKVSGPISPEQAVGDLVAKVEELVTMVNILREEVISLKGI